MTDARQEPHFVRQFTISDEYGTTRVRIADNYCRGMTREDVERALEEIARTAQAHIDAAVRRNEKT